MTKPKRIPAVRVEWVDSTSFGGWRKREAYSTEMHCSRCVSVGWLLRRDRKETVLVLSLSDNDDAIDALVIPSPCVKRLTYLKERA